MDGKAQSIPWKRSKKIARLLAVFFGPWTWLYTYRRDPGKAALGLGLNISMLTWYVSASVTFLVRPPPASSLAGESLGYSLVGLLQVFFVTWLSAVISTYGKREWILNNPEKRTKVVSFLLAIFLGPWTWLYTYNKDMWKFWPATLFGLGGLFLAPLRPSEKSAAFAVAYLFWLFMCIVIWISAIVTAGRRKDEWYMTYSSLLK